MKDGGAFIHMNSDAYSIYFLFIPISENKKEKTYGKK